MRKSLRLFLVLAMACMMSLSFFFAGSLLAKADGSVDFAATEGASIYFAGDGNDLGINYQIKLKKQDFDTLKNLPENAGKTIAFGGVFGLANGNLDELTADTGSVVISNTDGVFESLDEDYYVYNAELILDTDAMYEEEMASQPGDVITLSEYKKQLIAMPWVVRPFYTVYEGEFNSANAIYGEVSSARMLFAVAAAVEAAGEDTPFDFKDKYQYNSQVTDYVVTLDAEGNFGGDAKAFTENTVAFIVGDNAEMFMYQDGQHMAAYSTKTVAELASLGMTTITTVDVEDGININASRHSFAYAEESVDSIAINAEGKMYLNRIDTTDKVITSAFVDGVDVLKEDGTLDLALAGKEVGDKFLLVLANETSNLFAIANAEVYDKVFENTPESRKEMARLFSAGDAKSTSNKYYKQKVVEGYYALAESLTFSSTNKDNEPYTDEAFANNDTISNIFRGTFDGRGYTLNNVIYFSNCEGGMFGFAGDGATVKNVAINGTGRFKTASASYDTAFSPYSMFFYSAETATSRITVENVYVKRTGSQNGENYGIFFYSAVETGVNYIENYNETGKTVEEKTYATGILTFNNVVTDGGLSKTTSMFASQGFYYEVEWNEEAQKYDYVMNGNDEVDHGDIAKYPTTVRDGDTITNTYFVGGKFGRKCGFPAANGNNVFNSVSAMSAITKTEDFVNSGFWSVVDGQLCWANLAKVAYVLDSESQPVESISASGVYTLGVLGVDGEIASVVTSDSENVIVNGNQITVAGGYFSANVTIATLDGNYSKTFAVSVDEREAVAVNEEILLSETSGKLYLKGVQDEKGAEIENIEIESISYNGKAVYVDGAWDFEVLDVAYDTSFVLTVSAVDNKYSFNNVVLYTEYFENTEESRAAFVKAIGGEKGASNTGAYALIEDLYFDGDDSAEQFEAVEDATFNGIFNGRGYTLFNVTTAKIQGMFGGIAGTATLKNFAIKGISALNDYSGILFGKSTADTNVTMENVYIYRYVDNNKVNNTIFVYNVKEGVGAWNMSNVIVEQEFDSELTDRKNGIFHTKNATLSGNVADTYFLANGDSANATSADGNLKYYRGTNTYPTLADARKAMVEAEYNYNSFSSDYWLIDADGLPAWKTCYTDVVLLDSSDENVTSSTFVNKNEEYKVVAYYNGEIVDAILAKVEESELVSISGNVVTIGAGTGSVVVNVSYNETVIGSITFNVDTRSVTSISQEILVSKANNTIYFEGTPLESADIKEIVYEGASIYADGVIDTANLTQVGPENAYTFRVELQNGDIYELTNVVVCTEIFFNTPSSRAKMATTFGLASSGDSVAELTGYFILGEDLYFDANNGGTEITNAEMFGGKKGSGVACFNATFDGRGHTLNNVIMEKSGAYQWGMFGESCGLNTVLKNFAINGVLFYDGTNVSTTPSVDANKGLLFVKNTTVYSDENNKSEISNVYITLAPTASFALFYNAKDASSVALGFKTWSNVIVNYVFDEYSTSNLLFAQSNQATTAFAGLANISNTYLVCNGMMWGKSTGGASYEMGTGTFFTNNPEIKGYKTMADMKAAANDYSSFSSNYWTVIEGEVPVWNTLPAVNA